MIYYGEMQKKKENISSLVVIVIIIQDNTASGHFKSVFLSNAKGLINQKRTCLLRCCALHILFVFASETYEEK